MLLPQFMFDFINLFDQEVLTLFTKHSYAFLTQTVLITFSIIDNNRRRAEKAMPTRFPPKRDTHQISGNNFIPVQEDNPTHWTSELFFALSPAHACI